MPRSVEFEGTIHQFPDDASDEEIGQALNAHSAGPAAPTQSPSMMDQLYHTRGAPLFGASMADVVEGAKGAAKGLGHTLSSAGSLLTKGQEQAYVPGGSAAVSQQTAPYTQPTNTAQKVGYGLEQAGEFLAPGGVEEDAARALAKGGGKLAGALTRSAIKGGSAAGVAGLQTGGDPKAMATAGALAGGTSAALEGASAMLPSKTQVAQKLYGSALKPAPSMANAEREAIINTGLKEGIVLNPDVVSNVQARIDGLNGQIAEKIAQGAEDGMTVDPRTVAKYADRSANRFANQVNPDADLAAIQNTRDEFLATNSKKVPFTKIRPGGDEAAGTFVPEGQGTMQESQPIPLDKAQKMKQGTYAKLKDSYGEQASASREAQKDLARGLKDQIVEAFPEIADLNAKESALLRLEASLERFVGRHGNHELIGIGTPLTTLAAHAGGAPVVPIALTSAALKNAAVRSRLAIALAKAAQNPGASTKAAQAVGNLIPSAAAYAGMPPPGQQQGTMPPPGGIQ